MFAATEQAMEKTLIDLSKEAKLDSTKFFFVSIHFKNVNHFFCKHPYTFLGYCIIPE